MWPARDDKRAFAECYELGEQIGKGANAAVYACTLRADGSTWAVKVVRVGGLQGGGAVGGGTEENGARQAEVMRHVDHPNIIRLAEYFESADEVHLVTELATGGELFDRIVARYGAGGSGDVAAAAASKPAVGYSEHDARGWTLQILRALGHMHKRGIAHCDLKPENILFASSTGPGGNSNSGGGGSGNGFDSSVASSSSNSNSSSSNTDVIKVADFGFAQLMPRDAMLRKMCGTSTYVAPEVLNGAGMIVHSLCLSLSVSLSLPLSLSPSLPLPLSLSVCPETNISRRLRHRG
jgi:serine/threonine protein kinase